MKIIPKNFLKYSFKNNEYIIEKLVNFKKEISIVITRGKNKTESFDAFENLHKHQILKNSKIPANINKKLNDEAKKISKKIIKVQKQIEIKRDPNTKAKANSRKNVRQQRKQERKRKRHPEKGLFPKGHPG